MDLDRHVWKDLGDVATLYERKQCSMGIVRLKLQRASTAFILDRPHWSETLAQVAQQAETLEDRDADWLEGMVLIDRIRSLVREPPRTVVRPTLELVRDDESGDADQARRDTLVPEADAGAVPDDAGNPDPKPVRRL